jgi:DNA-binding PadR family transcriptional regulator
MYYNSLILGLILYKPVHCYEIKEHLEQFNRNINGTKVSNNTIYPLLSRFEKRGFTTRRVIAQDGKPNKILYEITDYGRRQFFKSLNTVQRSVIVSREEFCIRLVFWAAITPKNRRQLLDQRTRHLEESFSNEEHPVHQWPVVAEGFDLSPAAAILVPFYNEVLSTELAMIERFRARVDKPCTIPAQILQELEELE